MAAGTVPEGWQEPLINQLRALVEPDDDGRALLVFGSMAVPGLADRFSDVDAAMVVHARAVERFYPDRDWLAPLGAVFASDRFERGRGGVHRICFDDMRWLDLVVIADDAVDLWLRSPFRLEIRTIFSRSPVVDAALAVERVLIIAEPPDVDTRVARFWLSAEVAMHKAVRGDLLIALHLQLGLVRDCLQLAMILRDRVAGTQHHRTGTATDAAILARLDAARHPHTAAGLLDAIEASAAVFDDLAAEWDAGYERKVPSLRRHLDEARTAI